MRLACTRGDARSILSPASGGFGAADTDRLDILTGRNGDIAAHVPIAVACADDRVLAGLQLVLTPGEYARETNARYRNTRSVIGYQRKMHRLVEIRQQNLKARDLRAQHRPR